MQRGRRMAFDYGDVRIGVAISDPDSIVISPLPALDAQSPELDKTLKEIIEEYEPILLIVGEPRHLSGAQSSKMNSVSDFIEFLKEFTDLEIHTIDERLSTVSAAGKLRDSGKNAKSSKALIDSAAASEILEFALNLERSAERAADA